MSASATTVPGNVLVARLGAEAFVHGTDTPRYAELRTELLARLAEVERLRADAERYRFVRDNPIGLRAVDGNAARCQPWPDMDAVVDLSRASVEASA